MNEAMFESLVNQICEYLRYIANKDPMRIANCRTGDDFELIVYDAINQVLQSLCLNPRIEYKLGSHVFPDFVLNFGGGARYGIEVKSSSGTSRSWKINGNSVLGSTKKNVIATYIIFGKTAVGYQDFRCKRYEDCIADVAVTHSPRYRIDMDLDPHETFFAKSGLSYEEIYNSPNPIELITSYFRSHGAHAWWLTESSPAAIRMFSNLSQEEQKTLIGYCFAHFPEVFSSASSKFHRCATWLAAEHSIVSSSLRDNFSAGGRFEYCDFGLISRIYKTLDECKDYVIRALNEASVEQLYTDWGWKYHPRFENADKFQDWLDVASNNCPNRAKTGYNSYDLLCRIMR